MNTLTKGFAKRVISMLLVTIMVFSLGIVGLTSVSAANTELAETGGTFAGGEIVYFKPSGWWTNDGADFIVTFWKTGSSKDVELSLAPGYSDIYHAKVPTGNWTNYQFRRVQPGTTTPWGDGAYGPELTYDKDYSKNIGKCYVITNGSGSWDGNFNAYKVYLSSNIYSTNWSDTEMTLVETHHTYNIYSVDVNVPANSTCKFKMKLSKGTNDDIWLSYTGTITDETTNSGCNFSTDVTADCTFKTTTGGTYTFNFNADGKVLYVNCKDPLPVITLDPGTLTVTPSSPTVGDELTFKTKSTLKGSQSNIHYTLYEDDKAVKSIEVTYDKDAVFTYTPTAGQHKYYVESAVGTDLKAQTQLKTITVKDVLTASITEYTESGIAGVDTFAFTVTDNAASFGDTDPTYKLFYKAEGAAEFTEMTDVEFVVGTGTVQFDNAGKYQVYVTVTTKDNKSVSTEPVTVAVEANTPTFSIDVKYPTSVFLGVDLTLTATSKVNHIKPSKVTYTLVSSVPGFENIVQENNGKFTIPASVTDTLAEGTYTFEITAVADYNGFSIRSIKTVTINLNEATGESSVKVYFKSSVSYGYRPNISTDGGKTFKVMTPVSYLVLPKNDEQSANYAWYVVDLGVLQNSEKYSITIKGNRNYFYTGTYVIDLLNEKDIVLSDDGSSKEIYLALDNLNDRSPITMSNVTLSPNRDWLLDAAHMIIPNDIANDPLAAVAFCYKAYSVGDSNTDGKLNIRDATLIQKDLANITDMSDLGQQVSDVNGDGKVTIKDATALQKQIAGL